MNTTSSINTKIIYTCWGSVRGHCDKVHLTLKEAHACCAQDAADITSAYVGRSYSDRNPRELKNKSEMDDFVPGYMLGHYAAQAELAAQKEWDRLYDDKLHPFQAAWTVA